MHINHSLCIYFLYLVFLVFCKFRLLVLNHNLNIIMSNSNQFLFIISKSCILNKFIRNFSNRVYNHQFWIFIRRFYIIKYRLINSKMKSSVGQHREFSNKTIYKQQKPNYEKVIESSISKNGNNYIDTQTNRIIKSRIMSKLDIQQSIVYKNMKLTTMIQNISSFTTCLYDTKWIFNESYKIIKEFLIESSQYFDDKTIKRIKLDNIGKQYLNLKRRFDQIDLKQISQIVARFIGQKSQKIINRESVNISNSVTTSMSNNTTKCVKQPVMRERKNSRSNIENEIVEQNRMRLRKIEKLQKQYEEKRHQNQILIQKLAIFQKDNQILRNIVLCKKNNQINLIQKIKMTLKDIRQIEKISNINIRNKHLQNLILNFSNFQNRIKQYFHQLQNHSHQSGSIDFQIQKKQALTLQINSMLLQIDNLKNQKDMIEKYMQIYAQEYEQKKRIESQIKNTSIQTLQSGDKQTLYLLWMQASCIQNILNSEQLI